jgi:cytochrome-b5 reductase
VYQHARRYATQAPQEKKTGGFGMFHTCVALALVSGGYFYMRRQNPLDRSNGNDKSNVIVGQSKPAFTGGDQGFISLMLEKSELVNHNTKRLTFKLPEPDMDSGLHVASAVITKYKGPEMEKPVIRPYTPVSDVGESYAGQW